MWSIKSEVTLSRYNHEIQQWILTWSYTWFKRLVCLGCTLDTNLGEFVSSCETPLGLVRFNRINYRTPKGREEMVEIVVTQDQTRQPVVMISGTHRESVMVSTTGIPDVDIAKIKEEVLNCFDSAGIDIREPFVEHSSPAGVNQAYVWWC